LKFFVRQLWYIFGLDWYIRCKRSWQRCSLRTCAVRREPRRHLSITFLLSRTIYIKQTSNEQRKGDWFLNSLCTIGSHRRSLQCDERCCFRKTSISNCPRNQLSAAISVGQESRNDILGTTGTTRFNVSYFWRLPVGAASHARCTTNRMCAKNGMWMRCEQAVIAWARRVVSIVACCHSVKALRACRSGFPMADVWRNLLTNQESLRRQKRSG